MRLKIPKRIPVLWYYINVGWGRRRYTNRKIPWNTKRVLMEFGVYNLFHIGHWYFLRSARERGCRYKNLLSRKYKIKALLYGEYTWLKIHYLSITVSILKTLHSEKKFPLHILTLFLYPSFLLLNKKTLTFI